MPGGGGSTWRTGMVTTDEGFVGVRTAVAADQIGLAVYATTPSSGAKIHAVPVGPTP